MAARPRGQSGAVAHRQSWTGKERHCGVACTPLGRGGCHALLPGRQPGQSRPGARHSVHCLSTLPATGPIPGTHCQPGTGAGVSEGCAHSVRHAASGTLGARLSGAAPALSCNSGRSGRGHACRRQQPAGRVGGGRLGQAAALAAPAGEQPS